MTTSKCCKKVSFEYFWVRFLGINRKSCKKSQCAIKWKFFSYKILRKLRKTKAFIFENFQKCQLHNAVGRWVLGNLSPVFGDQLRKWSRSPLSHKVKIFLYKIVRKLRKTKTFISENFQQCQLQNAVERLVLRIFECGFWLLTEKVVKKPTVALNGNFLNTKFWENWEKRKLSFLKISGNVNLKML